jgi:hypothetical protein
VLTSALEELEENEDIQILGAVINGAKIRVAEAQQQDLSPQIPAEQNRGAKPTRETAPPQKKVPVSRPIDF